MFWSGAEAFPKPEISLPLFHEPVEGRLVDLEKVVALLTLPVDLVSAAPEEITGGQLILHQEGLPPSQGSAEVDDRSVACRKGRVPAFLHCNSP